MALITQPLRSEHQQLLPHIEELRAAADAAGEMPQDLLRARIDDALHFLRDHLIPHARAEDRALYPVVAAAMGAPEATATMSRDHEEVKRLTDELAAIRATLTGPAPDSTQINAVRRALYGLYALVRVHFAKEEEIYLPLLDARLTPEEAQRMFTAIEAATTGHGHHGRA